MARRVAVCSATLLMAALTGCGHTGQCAKPDHQAKTLFNWAIGPEDEKKSNGDEKASVKPAAFEQMLDDKKSDDEKSTDADKPERLVSDRPDFTEASTTVGRGHVQLEVGYTFIQDRANGVRAVIHSHPEALLRIGLFADWFELRLGQNVFVERTKTGRATEQASGLQDFYLGTKLALSEQKKYLPETAIIFQTLVPTGADAFTNKQLLPGFNYLCSWDVIEDCLSMGGSVGLNRVRGDDGHFHGLANGSFTVGYTLTANLTAYTEVFGLVPTSATAADTGPVYYFNGGFQYFLSEDFAIDVRAGVGLNRRADDFFTGIGFVYRR